MKNKEMQNDFFSNLSDFVNHLRWLFLISEGKTITMENIRIFVNELYEQINQVEPGTKEIKDRFIETSIAEFSNYEEYVTDKIHCFCLSDLLNPDGKLLGEIRDNLKNWQSLNLNQIQIATI